MLAQLGVEFSSEPDEALTGIVLQTLAERLQGKQMEELVNLPLMSDPRTIAAMQLLAMLFTPVFVGNPALLLVLSSTIVMSITPIWECTRINIRICRLWHRVLGQKAAAIEINF